MAASAPRLAAAAREMREVSGSAGLAGLPQAATAAPMRAGGPGARLPPRRGGRPVSGLCGALQPLARARRAAVTWRRPGRDVTGRGAAEVWARIPRAHWTAAGCGRGERAGVRRSQAPEASSAGQGSEWMA